MSDTKDRDPAPRGGYGDKKAIARYLGVAECTVDE
jgi:hypothetical protein